MAICSDVLIRKTVTHDWKEWDRSNWLPISESIQVGMFEFVADLYRYRNHTVRTSRDTVRKFILSVFYTSKWAHVLNLFTWFDFRFSMTEHGLFFASASLQMHGLICSAESIK